MRMWMIKIDANAAERNADFVSFCGALGLRSIIASNPIQDSEITSGFASS